VSVLGPHLLSPKTDDEADQQDRINTWEGDFTHKHGRRCVAVPAAQNI